MLDAHLRAPLGGGLVPVAPPLSGRALFLGAGTLPSPGHRNRKPLAALDQEKEARKHGEGQVGTGRVSFMTRAARLNYGSEESRAVGDLSARGDDAHYSSAK